MRREVPPSNVYLEYSADPELPAEAKERRERERGSSATTAVSSR